MNKGHTLRQHLTDTLQLQINQLYPDSSQRARLDPPPPNQAADYASSAALSLAKQLKQNPMEIANHLAEALRLSGDTTEVESVSVAAPGFINIVIKESSLLKNLEQWMGNPLHHPAAPGRGQRIMVEFSSPNIAKPFNVGHLRSTIIGDSLARVYEYLGYEVLRDNHLGDWGTQYGKLAYAVENWGDWAKIEADPIPELFKLYVRINEEAKDDPGLQEAAREYFKRLEQGDTHVRTIWQKLSDLSMADFDRLYQMFNVHFDMMLSEAFYEPYLNETIQECVNAGIAQESQGALVIFPPGSRPQDPPVIIRKSNGTSTYDTRDLAGIRYRFQHFRLDKLVIEIGNEQQFYFQRIIAIAEKMSWIKAGQVVHVGHGLFLGSSGKRLSTRKGETVWLQELVQELKDKALDIISDKSSEMNSAEKQKVAQEVAIGALKYNDLSQNRNSNIVFDKEKALSLEGNSAPYLQYTVARAKSVLRQAGDNKTMSAGNPSDMTVAERSLAVALTQLDDVVAQVADDYSPSHIAAYLFQTAQKFNTFYQSDPILNTENSIRQRRLLLTAVTANILTVGLGILGVSVPDRM